MQKQWQNHNINLKLLAQTIQNTYTQKRGLKTKTQTSKNKWQIKITLTDPRTPGTMNINITGAPNNFTIETKATEIEEDAMKIGLATSLFGGGYILYSSVKTREELEKLETEFWTTIEETIAKLVNTATKKHEKT
ncbi:MAG: hypothetical protein ACQXXH_07065 [Candidatus Bathyarchaeia archaeon]|jgi:hypothetical protein|nr:hypothetical protein [Candidatus Bathyarchaeota archaeon A05DMB-4]MDH7595740.1 hypothetical protein [Candidatus Bathyarchaeota archaeon]